ncbi:hypothetical protein [Marixanthomonas ophiurae]|uniref:Uncharacterized protein n=1 Tax=Marixanthomonas ophiurae TaxID=387659 RepID=A0A3E1Q969_9FLAO|nr:hypothetical protein [Marixanthomonas ophiurae]RFN58681.1 hypothetical protein DZ858_00960 [Marixanthomonas ophiurae]
MTKKIILTLFLFASISSYAQKTLNDYSFIIVPEQFDFLEGKDKYKLSSLTEFLFNKHGFNAFLASKAPNVKRCNGLYADIKEDNSFFRTKLIITIKDCNENIVYTSNEGVSKFKEYKKAYQDATRKAFESIEALNIQQKDIEILQAEEINEAENVTETITRKQPIVNNTALGNLPNAKFSNYKKDGKSYLLRKTDKGYSLYEESSEAENGLQLVGALIKTDSEVKFTNLNGETYDVYFDEDKNLSIFKGEEVILYNLVR